MVRFLIIFNKKGKPNHENRYHSFVCLDDFCKLYEVVRKEKALVVEKNQRHREGLFSLSEMMLIEVLYHFSPFKDFKRFYLYGICHEYKTYFGKLPTYQRFVALKRKLFVPMSLLLHSITGQKTGLYFADSTS